MPSVDLLHLDGNLWPFGTPYQFGKDVKHGLSALPRTWGSLYGGLQLNDDGRGTQPPGTAPPAGPLTQVKWRLGGGVLGLPWAGP